MQLSALFRLAFATAPLLSRLTLLHTSNSPAHYAKGTPSGPKPLRLLVGIRFQELFHSPSRSAFHLSLTGTSTLSVTREYLALEGGPPRFPQGFTCPVVLGNFTKSRLPFRLQGYHLLWLNFPDHFGYGVDL
jgi:hypothetical protein